MAIKAIVFDFDGTILNSFFSASRVSGILKFFCFRYLKFCYLLLEAAEIMFRLRWPPHQTAMHCIRNAREAGLTVGIVTDRSRLSFVSSVRRNRLDLEMIDFVHTRASVLDRRTRRAGRGPVFLRSRGRKDAPCGLSILGRWLEEQKILHGETLMVGDAECDRRAAGIRGFTFVRVDRHCPDFGPVFRLVEESVNNAPEK